ncbi:MAG: YceI family protein [Pseudomonadota bacterium]
MPLRRSVIVALCLGPMLATTALAGEPETYRLDPVHTRVMFAIDHAGFSKAIGTVSGSTGQLVFDPEDWSSARLRASVPMTRVDLGDAAWNRATLAGNLLDAEDHPVAEFVSTRVEPIAPDRASVYGTLTLRGATREVVLDVKLNAAKRHPLPPFRRTLGFSATTTLSRKAFGIDAWPSVIGDAVELRIEAEAVRDRGEADDATVSPEPSSSPAEAAPQASPDITTEPTP